MAENPTDMKGFNILPAPSSMAEDRVEDVVKDEPPQHGRGNQSPSPTVVLKRV